MPRFFFHVVNDTSSLLDQEGTDLPDANQARQHAREIICEILVDEIRGDKSTIHLSALIDNAEGVRAAKVTSTTHIAESVSPIAA